MTIYELNEKTDGINDKMTMEEISNVRMNYKAFKKRFNSFFNKEASLLLSQAIDDQYNFLLNLKKRCWEEVTIKTGIVKKPGLGITTYYYYFE